MPIEPVCCQKTIGKELTQLWANSERHHNGVAPYCPKYLTKGGILILGLNPSEGEGDIKGNEPIYYENKDGEKHHPYFGKFPDLVPKAIPWSHLDLLFVKQTKQSMIIDLYSNQEGGLDFVFKQLELSQLLIEEVDPSMIIVANTLSRRFLGFDKRKFWVGRGTKRREETVDVWLDYDFSFDDNWGTHSIVINDDKKIPVFLSSMITGQRALDLGSFRRLQWHIKFVLQKLNLQS